MGRGRFFPHQFNELITKDSRIGSYLAHVPCWDPTYPLPNARLKQMFISPGGIRDRSPESMINDTLFHVFSKFPMNQLSWGK